MANDPDMDGDTLYAVDRGPANLDLIRAMPDRTPYVQRLSEASDYLLPRRHPKEFDVSYERVRVLARGRARAAACRCATPWADPSWWPASRSGTGRPGARSTPDSELGDTYETTFVVGPGRGHATWRSARAYDTIAVSAGFSFNEGLAWKTPQYQVRYDYRLADGELEVMRPR